jgi:hypothetical protein
LNVIQRPSPTSGSLSPVEGIGRVRIGRPWAAAVKDRKTEAAPAATREDSRVRRLSVAVRVEGRSSSEANTKEELVHSAVPGIRRRRADRPPHDDMALLIARVLPAG